jgi:capsular exopolysaccharide synthesis family protein
MAQAPAPLVVTGPAALNAAPNAWALLRALRRRWFLALSAGIALAALVGGATWAVVPSAKYRARATVKVDAAAPKILFDVYDADYTRYQRKQLSLLRMRSVLTAALRDPNVIDLAVLKQQEDAVEWLDKNFQALFPNNSEFLQISMEGDNPRDVAALVNAVLDAYMKEIVEKEQTDRQTRLQMLRDTFNKYEDGLKEKRKYLKTLAQGLGSDDKKTNEARLKLEMERLDLLTRDHLRLQSDILRVKTELAVLQGQEKALSDLPIPDSQTNDALARDPALEPLRRDLADHEAAIIKFLREHPVLKEKDQGYPPLQRRLEELQRQLEAQEQKVKPRLTEQLRAQRLAQTRADIGAKQLQISASELHEKSLADHIKHLNDDLKQFQQGTLDLVQIQKEMDFDDKVSTALGNELTKVTLEIGAQPRISVAERAEVPQTKDETKPLKMAGMAALGAFGCGLLGICWLEFRARRVDTAEDVVHGLGMRLVGSLPPLPRRYFLRKSKSNGRWHTLMAESIDATRTLLVHNARLSSLRVLMVTSAVTGEGKTSVSCHLATSLARGGYRTLLVDGDLRRPAVHRLFGIPVGPGLSEMLRGETADGDVSRMTQVPGLWVIPAGHWDPAATRALAQNGARSAFERLKNSYDFILVDTSPVLPVVDSLLISQHVDAVLFSVLRDVSCLGPMYTAQQRLTGLGVRILGVIVNGTREHHPYRYYNGIGAGEASRTTVAY